MMWRMKFQKWARSVQQEAFSNAFQKDDYQNLNIYSSSQALELKAI